MKGVPTAIASSGPGPSYGNPHPTNTYLKNKNIYISFILSLNTINCNLQKNHHNNCRKLNKIHFSFRFYL